MDTPICDFVTEYAKSGVLRLHMPGHKGHGVLGVEHLDITEISGADVLYSADGIIERSQRNAAALFGSGRTLYSTEGSSLCIRAMLYLAVLYAGQTGGRPIVLAGRNAHKAFISAAALLDLEIEWLYPGERSSILGCEISADALDAALCRMQEKPAAVYITSPDYLGNVADIAALSAVCRRYGVLLLVDNAHGAYLNFLPESKHPMALGADLCCDSAHKTLPVLTGGAYLHISADAPGLIAEQAESAMSLFASTSPSYLILQSLDAANKYLSDGYRDRLAAFCDSVAGLKFRLVRHGFSLIGDEPLKLTICAKQYGYTGFDIAQFLRSRKIEAEFSDPDYVVMMLTPQLSEEGLDRLGRALEEIERREAIESNAPVPACAERVMSIRKARFSPSVELDVRHALNRVLACENVSCPPAVPIVVCGERIDSASISCMEYYGIKTCRVVAQ